MVIVARIVTRPEKSAGGFCRSGGIRANRQATPPAMRRLRAPSRQLPMPPDAFWSSEMGEVVQLRDFQNPRDIERMRQALEREAAEILSQVDGNINVPYGGAGIDGMGLEKGE
jgi:hypothetical protein